MFLKKLKKITSACSFVALAQKLGRFDMDIASKLKIFSLEADSAHQTECSMKVIRQWIRALVLSFND